MVGRCVAWGIWFDAGVLWYAFARVFLSGRDDKIVGFFKYPLQGYYDTATLLESHCAFLEPVGKYNVVALTFATDGEGRTSTTYIAWGGVVATAGRTAELFVVVS